MTTAIIYGAQTGIIRRIVWTDQPETLTDHVEEGEAILKAPDWIFVKDETLGMVPDLDLITTYLTETTGIVPELGRCVVIHDGTGEVVDAIMADPTIDAIEGHTLFQDAAGVPGSTPDQDGNFV